MIDAMHTSEGLGAVEGLAEDGIAAAADLIWGERRVCCVFTRLLSGGWRPFPSVDQNQ